MKKITFNAPLNHKACSYEPMQIEVKKSLPSTARVPYESIDDYEGNWGELISVWRQLFTLTNTN